MPCHPLVIASELFREQFSRVLLRQRREAGLSQNGLAPRAAVSPHMIGYMEKGVRCPKIDLCARTVLALGTLPSRFFAQMEQEIGTDRLETMMVLAEGWGRGAMVPVTEDDR